MQKYMQKCDFNNVEVTLLYGCSSVNRLNIPKTPFFKNIWVTASVYMKVNTAYVCRHSLVPTPERQNQRRFGALIVNFKQISHFVLVPDFEQVNVDFVKF